MRKKFFIVTALVLALAAGLTAAVVHQEAGGKGRHHGWMLARMTKQLNLNGDQQAQIKTILETQQAKMQPLRQQLRQNRLAENGNTAGTFDETQARAFAAKQAQIMSDLTVERERTKSQILAVLTPDQRTKALALMQQRGQHRHHRKAPPQSQQPAG
jgi:Spy/CpxP family protein refolding chaperone